LHRAGDFLPLFDSLAGGKVDEKCMNLFMVKGTVASLIDPRADFLKGLSGGFLLMFWF
jgi:hypothetical protein